jgi:hypothetical protein
MNPFSVGCLGQKEEVSASFSLQLGQEIVSTHDLIRLSVAGSRRGNEWMEMDWLDGTWRSAANVFLAEKVKTNSSYS